MGTLLKALVILLVIAGGGGAYAYTSYVKPLSALQLQPAGVEPVSADPLILRVSVDIINPEKSIRLPGADLNLYMGDELIGKGKLPSEVVGSGNTRLHAEITIDKSTEELIAIANKGGQLAVDGTLYLKVLSFNVKVPIPKVPVPGELDASAYAGEQISQILDILPLLSEYKNQKLGDVLTSEDFKKRYKEKTGEDLTQAKIKELIDTFGKDALDKPVDELLAGGLQ